GSNELIDLLIRVFVPKECNIVTSEAAFIAYKLCARLQGCDCIEAPLTPGLEVSVEAILSNVNSKTRLVFLANPNNPTGTWISKEEVYHLASELNSKQVLLVLDYAYWEYVTDPSIPDPDETLELFPNTIVLRTFSKVYGLAGLRTGYMVADQKIAGPVGRSRQPFNITTPGLVGA